MEKSFKILDIHSFCKIVGYKSDRSKIEGWRKADYIRLSQFVRGEVGCSIPLNNTSEF